jgi:hypothetical protein
LTPIAGLQTLLDSAEAVVAAEILHVDDSATAVDGPLILEVKVLAVPKGRVSVGQTLRLWEAAQMAGTYHAGERRLLLLKPQRPIEPYHRRAAWWNMPCGLAVFIKDAAPDRLTLDALRQWLHEIAAVERAVPAVDIRRHGRHDGALRLTVTLTNTTQQGILFSLSCVEATFDAAQRHFISPITWDEPGTGGWVMLAPGERRSGTLSVDARPPEDMTTLPVLMGHPCLSFPARRVWVGYLTTEVPLSAMDP